MSLESNFKFATRTIAFFLVLIEKLIRRPVFCILVPMGGQELSVMMGSELMKE